VAVVGGGQLVLHHQHTAVGEILAHQVEGERAHRMLGIAQLQVNAEHVGQGVAVLQQPRREIVSLVRPDLPRVERLEPAQVHHHRSPPVVGGRRQA
jgi:hypothetical protein